MWGQRLPWGFRICLGRLTEVCLSLLSQRWSTSANHHASVLHLDSECLRGQHFTD